MRLRVLVGMLALAGAVSGYCLYLAHEAREQEQLAEARDLVQKALSRAIDDMNETLQGGGTYPDWSRPPNYAGEAAQQASPGDSEWAADVPF